MEKFNIKTAIYNEVKKYEELEKEIVQENINYDLAVSLKHIIDNPKAISKLIAPARAQIEYLFDPEEADKLVDKLIVCKVRMEAIKDDIDYDEDKELKKHLEELKEKCDSKFHEIYFMYQGLLKDRSNYQQYINAYRSILGSFKNNISLSQTQIEVINKYMMDKKMDRETQIKTMEYIRLYNQKINHPDYKISYTVSNMISKKWKKYEIEYNENQTRLLPLIDNYYETVKSNDEFITFLESLKETFIDEEEYQYIIKSILNKIVDDLEVVKEELKEVYEDEELRKVTIISHNQLKYRYFKIQNLCLEKINDDEPEKRKIVNRLFFVKKIGTEKTHIEQDLKNIRQEKYEELKYLLEGLEKDELAEDEREIFNSTNRTLCMYEKLKGDQTRALLEPLGNNNYAVLGAFIKKDDRDNYHYSKLAKRKYQDINMSGETYEEYENIKNRVFLYMDENKRKGNR